MAASVVTALMGHWADTAVIAAVVILNAVIGFVQEGKAEKALKAPSLMLQGVKGTPRVLVAVAAVFVLQLGFTYAPFMQQLFVTTALPLTTGVTIFGVGVAVLVILEVEKLLLRRLGVAVR